MAPDAGLGGSLRITSPDEPESIYQITTAVVRVGRSPAPENEVTLAHQWVSRHHLRIFCDRLPYRIQDMRSSNGTMLNDMPLPADEVRELGDGDLIAIGPFRLRFEAPPAAAEPPQDEQKAEEPRFEGLAVRPMPRRMAPPPPAAGPVSEQPQERWVGMPDQSSRWLQYLPPIYQQDFMGRFLLIFEDMLGPIEQIISHFDLFLDPVTTPATFLPDLNAWLAEMVDEHWSESLQRQMLKHSVWLYQARGTKAGLMRHLELCTGCPVVIEENMDGPHTFRVTIEAQGADLERAMLTRIIDANCPAHTRYTLTILKPRQEGLSATA